MQKEDAKIIGIVLTIAGLLIALYPILFATSCQTPDSGIMTKPEHVFGFSCSDIPFNYMLILVAVGIVIFFIGLSTAASTQKR